MTKPITTRTRRRRRTRISAPVRRRFGLRTRLTLTFAIGAAVLSAVLAFVTFGLTRQNLIDQRQSSSVTRAFANADRLSVELPYASTPVMVNRDLNSLSHPNDANAALANAGRWYATDPAAFTQREIPVSLLDMVSGGQAATMRTDVKGSTQLIDLRPDLLVQILIHVPDGAAVERPLLQVGGDACSA